MMQRQIPHWEVNREAKKARELDSTAPLKRVRLRIRCSGTRPAALTLARTESTRQTRSSKEALVNAGQCWLLPSAPGLGKTRTYQETATWRTHLILLKKS